MTINTEIKTTYNGKTYTGFIVESKMVKGREMIRIMIEDSSRNDGIGYRSMYVDMMTQTSENLFAQGLTREKTIDIIQGKKEREKKMTYFAQIVDAWDCELDFIGPFTSEDAANAAAFDKWDGEDGCRVYIVRRLPASTH